MPEQPDPLTELCDALNAGRPPPVAWCVRWAPDGTLTRAWGVSRDPTAMAFIAGVVLSFEWESTHCQLVHWRAQWHRGNQLAHSMGSTEDQEREGSDLMIDAEPRWIRAGELRDALAPAECARIRRLVPVPRTLAALLERVERIRGGGADA